MEYRVEKKYLVSDTDLAIIKPRLEAVMCKDRNQQGDSYEIRSVYFDDIVNSCVSEIEDGVDNRKKFRIRAYDLSKDFLRLEIKEKNNGFNRKQSCVISLQEYERLVSGDMSIPFGERKQLNELLIMRRLSAMKAKLIIRYERTAYTYPAGNVRITFDRNIAASPYLDEFFEARTEGMVPVLPVGMNILEVKYDEFLPDIISAQLETGKFMQTSFSKYYIGAMAVAGELMEFF